MKKHFIPLRYFLGGMLALLFMTHPAQAQKKVVPVSQSGITGIQLPAGSKKDSRLLTELAGKGILQMEAKKSGSSVNNIEVLYLPAGFTADSLNQACSTSGWSLTVSANDKEYAWLQKDGHSVLAYFSQKQNQAELYFGETNGSGQQQTVSNDAGAQNQNAQQPVNTDQQVQNQNTPQQTAEQPQQQPEQKPVLQDVSQPAVSDGYAFSTTNFDNGWTSKIYDDYVQVTKGNIKVLLGYRERFNESEYSGTGKEKGIAYWNSFVGKYFNLGEAMIRPRTTFSDYSRDYVEGWATDKQTGEKRFVAMMLNVFAYTGVLSVVVASAPDDQQLKQAFPKADFEFNNDLLPMYGYNKFAVGPNDLTGKWSTNGGSTMNWYSTTTGQNVGATGAVTADWFEFKNGGTYNSQHSGATGWVGSMNTYQQKYKGTYTVTDWNVTIDHRWDDKTKVCDAWFEIVKGGRILHLNEGSLTYKLMKE
jgi:hypothetical protein